jgi:arabinose-5-phosphate isomerase
MTDPSRIDRAREVLAIESQEIQAMAGRLDESFDRAIELILASRGKVICSGVGKSGMVARKLAATLSSTGTPAFFLDSGSALHGDIGIAALGDVLIAISNSGEVEELLAVIFAAKHLGVKVIALTGDGASTLATESDVVLDVGVSREACPLGLAPTASTTAALAMSDALAMVLMQCRRFTRDDYAMFHPGGSLGRRLKLRVADLMRTGDQLPLVDESATFAQALAEITAKGLGTTLVKDASGRLTGIVTDGDIRRLLQRGADASTLLSRRVGELMKRGPKTIDAEASVLEALRVMEVGLSSGQISSLAVGDAASAPVGIITLHDILGRGKVLI